MPRPTPEADLPPDAVRLLDESAARWEEGNFQAALRAAEGACARAPRAVAAWHLRASALAELGRLDDADAAFGKALDLDRDDPETLLSAAELLITRSGDDRDRIERGLEHALRGLRRARKLGDGALEGELALLAGMARNQLGDPAGAIEHLDLALARLGPELDARLERAIARFELCRFDDAAAELRGILKDVPDEAWAHHYLGLIEERRGDRKAAEGRFARARQLAPDEFAPPVALDARAFDAAVEEALNGLPEKVRRYLANVAIAVEDVPHLDDLAGSDPPLSPQILGIFRGSPLKDKASAFDPWAHFPSSIVLYQRNLERFAEDREDLIEQIGITLIHEVGHFLGFDEDDLRERGLD